MFGWFWTVFGGLWDFLAPLTSGRKQTTIVFLGIDDAGKSTLMFRLKEDKMTQTVPTYHPTCDTMTHGNLTFTAYDLGGHKQVRRVWRDYFPVADAFIFIIDNANPERFEESRRELNALLADPELVEVPMAILLNKVDLPGAVGELEATKFFQLQNRVTGKTMPRSRSDWEEHLRGQRPLEVFPCSILKRFGYGEALRWLATLLK